MELRRLRTIKAEIRVIGISDGGPPYPAAERIGVVGLVFRGGRWFDGVLKTAISKTGLDATVMIARMIKRSPHYGQIRVVMLDGLLFRRRIPLNVDNLRRRLKRPVIAIFEKKEQTRTKSGGMQFVKAEDRPGQFTLLLGVSGIHPEDALAVTRQITTQTFLPEPLRVSRMVAKEFNKRFRSLSKNLKDTRRANRTAT